jgi:hypothetical protein
MNPRRRIDQVRRKDPSFRGAFSRSVPSDPSNSQRLGMGRAFGSRVSVYPLPRRRPGKWRSQSAASPQLVSPGGFADLIRINPLQGGNYSD